MFKATQELARSRQEEADLIAEIYGAKATAKNLTAKLHHVRAIR
jgi:ABC-type enterochelin transport system substrate-binding protein